MQLKINRDIPYGIVLEGGGARGAYQIGAWKALREAGIRISGVAGSSVGALNGALICMDDLEKAEYIWENISYSKVMNVDEIPLGLLRDWKSANLKEAMGGALRILKEGGIDVTPLRRLIEETVDEERIRGSDRELFATTYSVDERKQLVLDVKQMPEGSMADALLASAYFLVFRNEKLGGKRFMDGGGLNNVPLDVLLDRGYKNIIVIRIYGLGFDTEKIVEIPGDVSVLHIAPRQDLGGTLEFDARRARRNMKLGYLDACRFLYELAGRAYYIDAPQSEAYYFDKMMSELELIKQLVFPYMQQEDQEKLSGYRAFTEQIFPALAKELKLKDGWDYRDLYLGILEESARKLKFKRMNIYTVDELVQKLHIAIRRGSCKIPVLENLTVPL